MGPVSFVAISGPHVSRQTRAGPMKNAPQGRLFKAASWGRPSKEPNWGQLAKPRPGQGRPQFDCLVRTGGNFIPRIRLSPWGCTSALGVALPRFLRVLFGAFSSFTAWFLARINETELHAGLSSNTTKPTASSRAKKTKKQKRRPGLLSAEAHPINTEETWVFCLGMFADDACALAHRHTGKWNRRKADWPCLQAMPG